MWGYVHVVSCLWQYDNVSQSQTRPGHQHTAAVLAAGQIRSTSLSLWVQQCEASHHVPVQRSKDSSNCSNIWSVKSKSFKNYIWTLFDSKSNLLRIPIALSSDFPLPLSSASDWNTEHCCCHAPPPPSPGSCSWQLTAEITANGWSVLFILRFE